MAQLQRKLLSTVLTALREGVAATHIADFINDQMKVLGKATTGTGAVVCIDTGHQCNISGVGKIYDEFIKTVRLTKYSGYGQEATTFYDKDFETAPLCIIKYDETFYKMPYDVRSS